MSMRVSVVVPCYNHEKFVAECLSSIDSQQHEDVEVIVVDDGSTDRTWERVRDYRWAPERDVRLIRTANRGAHAAFNRGLTLASGDYIALCNSDDFFERGRLATMLRALQEERSRFAFSRARYVDEESSDVTKSWKYATELHQRQKEIDQFPSVGFALIHTNVAISTGNFVFERSLLSDIGFFRPYRLVHDWDFALRALLFSEPIFVDQALYAYRLHDRNSFPSLWEAGATECPELMRRFLKAASSGIYPNKLAPSPRAWPGYFEYFVEEYKYQPYLMEWKSVDGVKYVPEVKAEVMEECAEPNRSGKWSGR
jgi:glycosyltransferase involved in cell wall biosynthesis